MGFLYNEVVRAGNSSARVKNFYEANNLIVLMDIQGEFQAGDTIIGDDSGYSYTFTSFNKSVDYDIYFDPTIWDVDSPLMQSAIMQDDGQLIITDGYYSDTTASRNDNPTYMVTLG